MGDTLVIYDWLVGWTGVTDDMGILEVKSEGILSLGLGHTWPCSRPIPVLLKLIITYPPPFSCYKDVYVKDLREVRVENSAEAVRILAMGQKNRRVAATQRSVFLMLLARITITSSV